MTNYKAFYWQSPEGLNTWPYRHADKWIFEDRLDQNPPRVARAYALIAAVLLRRLYRKPGRQVRILVHQASSARSAHCAPVPGSTPPELPFKPLDLLGRSVRDPGVPVPDACRFHSRRRQGGRRLENLGWHSLPNGQRGWCAAWEVRSRSFHLVGAERWFTVV